MPAKPITDAEHTAAELFRCAENAWNGIAGASHPPPMWHPAFVEQPDWHGQLDRYGLVIELVLKHRLACRRMPAVGDDGPSSQEILNEAKCAGHNARDVFEKLDGPTQEAIRGVYAGCVDGHAEFAAHIGRRAATFQEMLSWVKRCPQMRYSSPERASADEPYIPLGGEWSPRGSTAGRELPSFPGRLVDWAETEFEKIKPERTTSETIEAVCDRLTQPR